MTQKTRLPEINDKPGIDSPEYINMATWHLLRLSFVGGDSIEVSSEHLFLRKIDQARCTTSPDLRPVICVE